MYNKLKEQGYEFDKEAVWDRVCETLESIDFEILHRMESDVVKDLQVILDELRDKTETINYDDVKDEELYDIMVLIDKINTILDFYIITN